MDIESKSDLIQIEVCILRDCKTLEIKNALFDYWIKNARYAGHSILVNNEKCFCPGKISDHNVNIKNIHMCIVKPFISGDLKLIALCEECSKHTGHIAVFKESLVDLPQEYVKQLNL